MYWFSTCNLNLKLTDMICNNVNKLNIIQVIVLLKNSIAILLFDHYSHKNIKKLSHMHNFCFPALSLMLNMQFSKC